MADNSGNIESAANSPQAASADGQSVSARSIGDMVLADQYANTVAGAAKKNRGIRYTKMTSPGQIGRPQGGASFEGGGW